jgi:drug/metabolite transporter (DMT)-like permease
VTSVVIVSQIVGGLFLASLALLFREALPSPTSLLMGVLAGIGGVIGLLALYGGLANGRMGVVAPLAAVISAALPVLLSLFTEGLPKPTQLAGFVLALLAVWLLSGMGWRWQTAVPRQELAYAAVAGAGFALFFIFIDRVEAGSLFWPLTAARAASVSLLIIWVAVRREWVRPSPNQLPIIALAGVLDALGNAFFALAARLGRLDIAAVLASLYPGSTVLLARLILKEKLTRWQWLGVLLALAALVLITL